MLDGCWELLKSIIWSFTFVITVVGVMILIGAITNDAFNPNTQAKFALTMTAMAPKASPSATYTATAPAAAQ